MTTDIIVAAISTSGAVITAITALVLNYRGFTSLETRITGLENRFDARLNLIQSTVSSLQTDVALLKDRAGLQ